MVTSDHDREVVYLLDPNHAGLRLAVLGIMLFGGVVGAVVVPQIGDILRWPIPRLWGAFAGAATFLLILGNLAERYLQQRWRSGRELTVTEEFIELSQHGRKSVRISRGAPISQTRWYFIIPRGRGMPTRGSFCAAIRVAQAEKSIALYTFLSEKDAQKLPGWDQFKQLIQRKPETLGARKAPLSDAQSELRAIESERWQSGAEMNVDDFANFIITLNESH